MAANLRSRQVAQSVLDRILAVKGNPPDFGGGKIRLFQVGGIARLVAREEFAKDLPALLVRPAGGVTVEPWDTGWHEYRLDHHVRILYLRTFDPAGDIEPEFWDELDSLAHIFLDDLFLGTPSWWDPDGFRAPTTAVDPYASEGEALAERGVADILAGAVTVTVRMRTGRP